MAQVTVTVNGKTYPVGCEDGQEPHVLELAGMFDQQVTGVAAQVGQLGETRLFLMGALLLADELNEARRLLAEVQSDLATAQAARARHELRAVSALDSAARRIEDLAAKAG